MTTTRLEAEVLALLALPRGRQADAIERLLAELPPVDEAWNTRFGPGSLFDAWTRTTVTKSLYAAHAEVLRPMLDACRRAGGDWRVIDVGVGNGRLWELVLGPDDEGEIVLIDPAEDAIEEVARKLPPGVRVRQEARRIEDALLPDADVIVCSLTLHHLGGLDAAQRAAHGLSGPGKLEVLRGFRAAITARGGRVLLAEADVHCEIDLLPGDPVLRDRLIDSYVRRCGLSLIHDLARPGVPEELRNRWRAILQRWCLEQVRAWSVPVAERDVYELDVGRWRALFADAGLEAARVVPTDAYGLFYQYLLV